MSKNELCEHPTHASEVPWAGGLTVQDAMDLIQYLEFLSSAPLEEISVYAKKLKNRFQKSMEAAMRAYLDIKFPNAQGAQMISTEERHAAKDKLDDILKKRTK